MIHLCDTQTLVELQSHISLTYINGAGDHTGVRNDSATNLARAFSYTNN